MERIPFKAPENPFRDINVRELWDNLIRGASGAGSESGDHWRTFFERREKFATQVADWMCVVEDRHVADDTISKFKSPDLFKKNLQQKVAKLFPEASPLQQEAVTKVWQEWIEDTLDVRQHMDGMVTLKTMEEGGRELFQKQTGADPQGKVHYTNKGPFLYFTFEKTEDYAAFKKAATGNDYEKEGGCYSERVEWNGKEIPTLLQVGLAFHKDVFTHEGQHFINHRLGSLFMRWEPEDQSPLKWPGLYLTGAQRAIKDELLAFLRDGSHPDRIYTTLSDDPLYKHLYGYLDAAQITIVKNQLKTITTALKKHQWVEYRGTVDHMYRNRLVASLLDIPFTSIEKYVTRSIKYSSVPDVPRKPLVASATGTLARLSKPLHSKIATGSFLVTSALAGIGIHLTQPEHQEIAKTSLHRPSTERGDGARGRLLSRVGRDALDQLREVSEIDAATLQHGSATVQVQGIENAPPGLDLTIQDIQFSEAGYPQAWQGAALQKIRFEPGAGTVSVTALPDHAGSELHIPNRSLRSSGRRASAEDVDELFLRTLPLERAKTTNWLHAHGLTEGVRLEYLSRALEAMDATPSTSLPRSVRLIRDPNHQIESLRRVEAFHAEIIARILALPAVPRALRGDAWLNAMKNEYQSSHHVPMHVAETHLRFFEWVMRTTAGESPELVHTLFHANREELSRRRRANEAHTAANRYLHDPEIVQIVQDGLSQPQTWLSHFMTRIDATSDRRQSRRWTQLRAEVGHHAATLDHDLEQEIQEPSHDLRRAIALWRNAYAELVLRSRVSRQDGSQLFHHYSAEPRSESIVRFQEAYTRLDTNERDRFLHFARQHAAIYSYDQRALHLPEELLENIRLAQREME